GAHVRLARHETSSSQGLRAQGPDQRDSYRGGDDPPHTATAGEASL
ncbi:MAG: hypothetical protein AVDCRST_MAG05-710, partial [uncultured Rubrobacteraceae bacterium]